MRKAQIDELYHLLRVASNISTSIRGRPSAMTSTEEVAVIYGMARHLLAGGDYSALVKFSAYYGEEYLLKPTCNAIADKSWEFNRVVEFGAGLGWLGRGIAARFGLKPTLFIDKRPWTLIDVVEDLETTGGRLKVIERLKRSDIIVMADFLHCVDDPSAVVNSFPEFRMAILEYWPPNQEYLASYSEQIGRYGASPFPVLRPDYMVEYLDDLFSSREHDVVTIDPYILVLAERET